MKYGKYTLTLMRNYSKLVRLYTILNSEKINFPRYMKDFDVVDGIKNVIGL